MTLARHQTQYDYRQEPPETPPSGIRQRPGESDRAFLMRIAARYIILYCSDRRIGVEDYVMDGGEIANALMRMVKEEA